MLYIDLWRSLEVVGGVMGRSYATRSVRYEERESEGYATIRELVARASGLLFSTLGAFCSFRVVLGAS